MKPYFFGWGSEVEFQAFGPWLFHSSGATVQDEAQVIIFFDTLVSALPATLSFSLAPKVRSGVLSAPEFR